MARTIRRSMRLAVVLVVAALVLSGCLGLKKKVELVWVVPSDGAAAVFNYAPITAEFFGQPEEIAVNLKPEVDGRVVVEGKTVHFLPSERYSPNTTYTVTYTWTGGEKTVQFTSINEVAELYHTDFSEYAVGQAPNDWRPHAAGDDATFAVVEMTDSPSGHALKGSNQGKQHSHLVAPSVTLASADNDILMETTVWMRKSEDTGYYLWNSAALWPPYVNKNLITTFIPDADETLRPYTITLVFHLQERTFDTYVNYALIREDEPFRADAPAGGALEYAVGLYFNSASSDVFWTDFRVAEIGR